MIKKTFIIVFFIFPLFLKAQGYLGPAAGNVEGGITKSTSAFSNKFSDEEIRKSILRNKPETAVNQRNPEVELNFKNSFSNEIHPSILNRSSGNILSTELDFEGPSVNSCWVPDCNITVGPVDILIAINTTFSITDKQGNIIFTVNTNNWFAELIGAGLVFDPKCFYDESEKRFIMTYKYFDRPNKTTLTFLCVSDDSSAAGSWNIWTLNDDLNGTVRDTTSWSDFPTLTVTSDAIYILNDMIYYSPNAVNYVKLRVVKKEDAMQVNPGLLNYTDVWDFKKPNDPSNSAIVLKLVHNLDNSETVYMIGHPMLFSSNSVYLYSLKNIFTTPEINSYNVVTTNTSWPPHMIQKGGGKPLQLNGFFYTEMVQRNGKIHAANSVSSQGGLHSDINYFEIDTENHATIFQTLIGNQGLSYGFPDMMVDDSGNVFMVFNRSGVDEYGGIFYTYKPAESAIFAEEIPLKEGAGNKSTFCSGNTNPYIRFEDFTDIMFDPADKSKLWLMGEYIGADNWWKTRIGKISIDFTIGISGVSSEVPDNFYLGQNYPNPFNPATTIEFSINENSNVKLSVFNILGKEVAVLVNGHKIRGKHIVQFDTSGFGNIDSGIYYYKIESGKYSEVRKMILIK